MKKTPGKGALLLTLLAVRFSYYVRPLNWYSTWGQANEKGEVCECCRYSGDPKLCQNCGYLSYAEIDQTLKLKPSAILNALKYF